MTSLTNQLCTHCGLCCDGTLLADVELASRKEAATMEVLGLAVDDDEDGPGLLPLPCSALNKKKCCIYEHRPTTCRTFECKLLQEAQRGVVTVAHAQRQIRHAFSRINRVKALLRSLGDRDERLPLKERCSGVLATDAGSLRKRAELERAMSMVESLIQKVFLS